MNISTKSIQNCLVCKLPFLHTSGKGQLCSKVCREIYADPAALELFGQLTVEPKSEQPLQTKHLCTQCGKEFEPTTPSHNLCSRECRQAYYDLPLSQRPIPPEESTASRMARARAAHEKGEQFVYPKRI